jgi:hypothetical protein
MTENKLEFSKESILQYLDKCIDFWREQKKLHQSKRVSNLTTNETVCYIDAFQSVRTSIFGGSKK